MRDKRTSQVHKSAPALTCGAKLSSLSREYLVLLWFPRRCGYLLCAKGFQWKVYVTRLGVLTCACRQSDELSFRADCSREMTSLCRGSSASISLSTAAISPSMCTCLRSTHQSLADMAESEEPSKMPCMILQILCRPSTPITTLIPILHMRYCMV